MMMVHVSMACRRGPRLAAALLAACALGGAREAGAQRTTVRVGGTPSSRVDTTFGFASSGTVSIRAAAGDVVVRGWSRDQIHVDATSDDDNIRLEAIPNRVTLDLTRRRRRGGDARLEVSVPYGVRVIAQTESGDITILATRGQVDAHAQNGDIRIEDVAKRLDAVSLSGDIMARGIAGEAVVSTLSGEIRLSEVRGDIDAGSVSGDVELRGVTAKTVRAKTTSGEVLYDGAIDPEGQYDLTTNSGDIRLRIPREANAQLTIATWNGTIDSQFPITLKPGAHGISVGRSKRFTFEIGGGRGRIDARTFSGDISISSNGRGASQRP